MQEQILPFNSFDLVTKNAMRGPIVKAVTRLANNVSTYPSFMLNSKESARKRLPKRCVGHLLTFKT
jgi:hypothetical protein